MKISGYSCQPSFIPCRLPTRLQKAHSEPFHPFSILSKILSSINAGVGDASFCSTVHSGKATPEQGLSEAELEKLPKLTGKDLVMEPECAICLEQIKSDQPARLLPGCNHGFHVHCADTWLSRNSVCPVCRIRINPDPLDSENPC
ncbi:E3 ubiquitin-protein ligase ATL23 [Vitis vinifera]|uniref:E3 ubiquitin-protein ligase ATL23 n=1 Tax=Vitis vinifera TaxID=29760 RepID=A0A438ETI9_VITVI|nr:E3 ubiquitin-protein ligase ATL23 [Vitis vinifera]